MRKINWIVIHFIVFGCSNPSHSLREVISTKKQLPSSNREQPVRLTTTELHSDQNLNDTDHLQLLSERIAKEFVDFRDNKETVSKLVTQEVNAHLKYSDLNETLFLDREKISVTQKSILEKKRNDRKKESDDSLKILHQRWPLYSDGFLTIVYAEVSKRQLQSISLENIRSLLASFLLEPKEGFGGLKYDCVSADFEKNVSCLESNIQFCSKYLTSSDGKLGTTYLDDELVNQFLPLSSNHSLAKEYLSRQFDQLPIDPSIKTDIVIGLCRKIASSGYSFNQTSVHFLEKKYPDWTLVFEKELYPFNKKYWSFDEFVSAYYPIESFTRLCGDRTENLRRQTHLLQLEGREDLPVLASSISRWVRTNSDRMKACNYLVSNQCRRCIQGNIISLEYRTQGCEARRVTIEDLENDADRWAKIGFTQAEINDHLELATTIRFCSNAHRLGYGWSFDPIDTSGCDREKKSKRS